MAGIVSVLYGGAVYLLFFGTFLYAVAFVGNLPAPKTIDSGESGALLPALIVNALLLGVFAIQHSVMARPGLQALVDALRAARRRTHDLCAARQPGAACCSTGNGSRS